MSRRHRQDKASETVADANHNGSSADAAQAPEESSGGGGFGRLLLLVLVAALLAVVLNEGLRSKALDLLFGAEEEFAYSSTTMPATDAPSSVGAAS